MKFEPHSSQKKIFLFFLLDMTYPEFLGWVLEDEGCFCFCALTICGTKNGLDPLGIGEILQCDMSREVDCAAGGGQIYRFADHLSLLSVRNNPERTQVVFAYLPSTTASPKCTLCTKTPNTIIRILGIIAPPFSLLFSSSDPRSLGCFHQYCLVSSDPCHSGDAPSASSWDYRRH